MQPWQLNQRAAIRDGWHQQRMAEQDRRDREAKNRKEAEKRRKAAKEGNKP